MSRAISLFSGGLDSMLAARLVMEQGVEVIALHFITPFFGYKAKGNEDEARERFLRKYGVKTEIIDASGEYIEMLRRPRYGYGKNFNPCIDCKIFMMSRAKAMMERFGAKFIVSGEVLGQRPMSQRKDALRIVERDSGLDYYLLRPLSAKLLKPTYPEEHGIIDREKLMDISGRSRKPQMALAERFGISDYQTPAGGCLLTDPVMSKRFRKFLEDHDKLDVEDLMLLVMGRHFEVGGGMLFVGRNKEENARISRLVREGDLVFKAGEIPGPVALFRGYADEQAKRTCASIVARYADTKGMESVQVNCTAAGGVPETLGVARADDETLERLRAIYG